LNGRREKVVIKEMSNYSAEELNRILMVSFDVCYASGFIYISELLISVQELHISNLMDRITDGCAVLRVMAVRLIKSPYLVIYPYINCRSYPDFASQYPSQLTSFDKINASESIAKTIVDMHSCGILHCNIGARNIFVRREIIRSNSNDQLLPEFTFLLGDFRKAVIAKSKSVDPMKPVNLRWLAPEVFKTKCLNSSTDVYAFGMTLYEIFTGNVPYYTRTAQEIRRKIIAGEYFRPALNKTLNEDLCELMRKCWLEEASERPSMKDVWMHLTRIHDSIIETIISP
uniref:Protein kinase domain-containing protein n=1 Tax=Anisakis simplex TaxID=6269 RepID=A0A0M3J6J8_ANISI